MFDIIIGTIIPISAAADMIPQHNTQGFECYTLDFNGSDPAGLPAGDHDGGGLRRTL